MIFVKFSFIIIVKQAAAAFRLFVDVQPRSGRNSETVRVRPVLGADFCQRSDQIYILSSD